MERHLCQPTLILFSSQKVNGITLVVPSQYLRPLLKSVRLPVLVSFAQSYRGTRILLSLRSLHAKKVVQSIWNGPKSPWLAPKITQTATQVTMMKFQFTLEKIKPLVGSSALLTVSQSIMLAIVVCLVICKLLTTCTGLHTCAFQLVIIIR